jgi:hypothetical protein
LFYQKQLSVDLFFSQAAEHKRIINEQYNNQNKRWQESAEALKIVG